MQYLGQSQFFDFLFCAGLGVASICVLVAATYVIERIHSSQMSTLMKWVVRIGVFLLGFAAQFAVALAIGQTKALRDANSILGFVISMGIGLWAFFLLLKKR
jgi:cytochrome bd-type quinol oxidase subunit 2